MLLLLLLVCVCVLVVGVMVVVALIVDVRYVVVCVCVRLHRTIACRACALLPCSSSSPSCFLRLCSCSTDFLIGTS